jgi:Tfp pilus assembly ATPase PilU
MGNKEGLRSLDQDLSELVEKQLITIEDAMLQSSAPAHLREIRSKKENVGVY